jgi:5'-nucleotidase
MKEILITNDDGFDSEALKALVEAVSDLGHVTVVAPSTNKSACGHSLTLTKPMRFISVDDDYYKLEDGTPSDCIYLALNSLFDNKKPDLVISGINAGANMGEDITYSGTASGAMEAVLHGVPAFSISQVMTQTEEGGYQYTLDLAKITARNIAKRLLESDLALPERRFLNVNIPNLKPHECKGYKVTKAAYRHYGNDAHLHVNPRGEEYYWLGLHPLDWRDEEGCDFNAVFDGYISITPIKLDMTCYDTIKITEEWLHQ